MKTLEMLGNCFGSDTRKQLFMSGMNALKVVMSPSRMNAVAGHRHRKPTKTSIKREMLINNRKLTIRELAEDLNIAYGSIQDCS